MSCQRIEYNAVDVWYDSVLVFLAGIRLYLKFFLHVVVSTSVTSTLKPNMKMLDYAMFCGILLRLLLVPEHFVIFLS